MKKICFSALFYAYLTLTLTKLKLWVLLVDYEKTTLAAYDYAVWGALLQ